MQNKPYDRSRSVDGRYLGREWGVEVRCNGLQNLGVMEGHMILIVLLVP